MSKLFAFFHTIFSFIFIKMVMSALLDRNTFVVEPNWPLLAVYATISLLFLAYWVRYCPGTYLGFLWKVVWMGLVLGLLVGIVYLLNNGIGADFIKVMESAAYVAGFAVVYTHSPISIYVGFTNKWWGETLK